MITKARKLNASGFRLFLVFLAFLAGGLGAATALFVSSRPLQREQSPEAVESIVNVAKLRRPVNVLVLGTVVLTSDLPENKDVPPPKGYLESLEGNLNGQSDTILLIRFDPVKNTITSLSVPRDTQVQIPEVGVSKINAANYVGGAVLSAKTVSNLLSQVTIDRYVRVNVAGFAQLIDALGGVDIFVPMDMQYQDDSQHLYINLKKGMQTLDGKKALQFARFRHDGLGDIGRIQRQQMLLRALAEQKLNLETVQKLPQLVEVIKQNIDTNLSIEEMLALVGFASNTDREKMQMLMLPGRFSTPQEYALSYWIPDNRHIKQLMAQYFNVSSPYASTAEETAPPAYIRIALQDSLDHPEAIRAMTQILADQGYAQVFPTEQNWAKPIEKTLIIAQSGDREAAEQVRKVLGVGQVVLEATGDIESDVTIRLGKDWLAKSQAPAAGAQPARGLP